MSKILLVDDDEFVVENLKTHLEEWGYGVVEASGGRRLLGAQTYSHRLRRLEAKDQGS